MTITSRPQSDSAEIFRESIYNAYKGLDLTDELTNMDPSCLRIASNADIIVSGAIASRAGYEADLINLWAPNIITNGIEFQVTELTHQVMISGCESVTGTGKFAIKTDPVTVIRSGLNNARPSFVQFGNLLFFFNGFDDFLYDGAVTRQIGITPPVSAPTGVVAGGGSLNGGVYVAVYTYYNSVTGAESSPSPLSAQETTVLNDKITWTVVPGDPLTADTIRLYRNTANGPLLFLDTTAAISATTIVSTQSDAGLGIELEQDNTQLSVWGTVKYSVTTNNRIFVTGFENPNQNRVRFSKVGQEGPMPESYQATGFADCISNGGIADINIGLGVAFQTPMVLKQNSIGRLDVSGSFTSEVGTDNVIYQYNEIARGITGVSHWAITNVLNNMVWLARDNIYMTDGTNVIPIATKIAQYIKTLDFGHPDKLSAVNDIDNRKVMFSVMSPANNGTADVVIVGSYQNYPEFYWTLYTQGPDQAANPGIQANCFYTQTQDNGSKDVYFGNVDYSGNDYHLGVGSTDNGKAIYFQVRDYPTCYGLQEEKKLFYKDAIFIEGNGANYNVDVSSVYDLVGGPTDTASLSVEVNADSLWDIAEWDVDDWAETGPVRIEYCTHNKAFFKQLDFVEDQLSVQEIYTDEVLGLGTGVVVGSTLVQAVSGATATVVRLFDSTSGFFFGVDSVVGTFDTTNVITSTNPDATTNTFISSTGVLGTAGEGQPIKIVGWTKAARSEVFK